MPALRCRCLDLLSPRYIPPYVSKRLVGSPQKPWITVIHSVDECVPTSEPEEVEIHWPFLTTKSTPPSTPKRHRQSISASPMDSIASAEMDSAGCPNSAFFARRAVETADLRANFPDFAAWQDRIQHAGRSPTYQSDDWPLTQYDSESASEFSPPPSPTRSRGASNSHHCIVAETFAQPATLAIPPVPTAAAISNSETESESEHSQPWWDGLRAAQAAARNNSGPRAPPLAAADDESVTEEDTATEEDT